MMRPRAALLMGTVYRGEYVIDTGAVAEAILARRQRGRRPSEVVETLQSGSHGTVRAEERQAAPGADVS
jgi:hypothetical protein